MKILLDTCIVIDTLQHREPFCDDSEKVFLAIANRLADGYITANSVTDIHYITHKDTHSEKTTREIMGKIFSLFDILDTTGNDCRDALFSNVSDYEDAVMIKTAEHNKVDYIVTRNIRDYSHSSVKVVTPDEFLKIIEV